MESVKLDQKPKQARSIKTEQALLDALERLLVEKPFGDLTVSELAREAGLTTGAIYRRFADKNDVLRAAFQRFLDRTETHDAEYPMELSDDEVLARYFTELMEFTMANIHLMRAANNLNDLSAFDQMTGARSVSAGWLASRLRTSSLSDDELLKRCRFVLRVATATYRDTFLSGRGAISSRSSYKREHRRELEALVKDMVELAQSHLGLTSST